jgi:hypothetical protein
MLNGLVACGWLLLAATVGILFAPHNVELAHGGHGKIALMWVLVSAINGLSAWQIRSKKAGLSRTAIGIQRPITDGEKRWKSNAAVLSRQQRGLQIGLPARSVSTRYFKRPIPLGSPERALHSSQEHVRPGIRIPWVRPLSLRRAAAGRSARADRLRKSVLGTSFGSRPARSIGTVLHQPPL